MRTEWMERRNKYEQNNTNKNLLWMWRLMMYCSLEDGHFHPLSRSFLFDGNVFRFICLALPPPLSLSPIPDEWQPFLWKYTIINFTKLKFECTFNHRRFFSRRGTITHKKVFAAFSSLSLYHIHTHTHTSPVSSVLIIIPHCTILLSGIVKL